MTAGKLLKAVPKHALAVSQESERLTGRPTNGLEAVAQVSNDLKELAEKASKFVAAGPGKAK